MIAPHTTYGTGQRLLFVFHGYGMDGQQFQVLKESLCVDYQIVGFHLPYHKGGPEDHEGWIKGVKETIEKFLKEKGDQQFSLAGYSIGSNIALDLLTHFNGQIQDVYLLAPYGLTRHWGISFLESGIGKGFFRLVASTSLPSKVIDGVRALGVISKDDHTILKRELDSSEKRQNLRKIFLLMSELKCDQEEVINSLKSIAGNATVVFGKHDAVFPRSGFKQSDRLSNIEILEVNEGHWLMTERLDETLAKALSEKI